MLKICQKSQLQENSANNIRNISQIQSTDKWNSSSKRHSTIHIIGFYCLTGQSNSKTLQSIKKPTFSHKRTSRQPAMEAGKVGTWLTVIHCINAPTYLPAFSPTTARFSSHNYKFLAERKNNLNESLDKVLKYVLASYSQPLFTWFICLPISFSNNAILWYSQLKSSGGTCHFFMLTGIPWI